MRWIFFTFLLILCRCGTSSTVDTFRTEHLTDISDSQRVTTTEEYVVATGNMTVSTYNLSTPPVLLDVNTLSLHEDGRNAIQSALSALNLKKCKSFYVGVPMSSTDMSGLKATFSGKDFNKTITIDSAGFEGVPQALRDFYAVILDGKYRL